MLVVDELKKNEPQLRLVALMLAAGLCILLAGLWWVQVVTSHEYEEHLKTQAYRSVRLPAVRGKILDHEGRVLAENRPRYSLCLYLDEMRKPFYDAYTNLLGMARAVRKQQMADAEKKLDRALTKTEKKRFEFKPEYLEVLREQARVQVAGSVVAQLGARLGQPIPLDAKKFSQAYKLRPYVAYPLMQNLDNTEIARFQETFANGLGVDLELESVRTYPNGTLAAHLLGYMTHDTNSYDGESSVFSYRLPDYHGLVGIEAGFDAELRGHAGEESVLINSTGYRRSESIEVEPEPGQNLVLTVDLDLQRAAEAALLRHQGANARAAVVVMDVHNGDVLAMASSPAVNPLFYTGGLPPDEWRREDERRKDEKLSPEKNRATQINYAPGSIFKVIVGLAALEAGLNPDKRYDVEADPEDPAHGWYHNGKISKRDTAPPGKYDFKRAIERSSNSYFIQVGLETGIDRIVALAEKFQLGERNSLPTRQEIAGNMPSLERVREGWSDGDTANVCIGQGEVEVTPLQMAVVYSAIANGGTVFWPRLVARVEPQDTAMRGTVTNFPAGLVRDRINVSGRSLRVLHDAMLGETEDKVEGTGKTAYIGPQMRICGKTGTAQVMDVHNKVVDHTTWFASFAPYESPRYAVVVMVESGVSGGTTCAPIAHDVYEAILAKQNSSPAKTMAAR